MKFLEIAIAAVGLKTRYPERRENFINVLTSSFGSTEIPTSRPLQTQNAMLTERPKPELNELTAV